MEKWLKQYLYNYNGLSEESKECEQYMKTTYKGDVYLPWAFMQRVAMQQDPECSWEVIQDYTKDNETRMFFLNEYNIKTSTEGKDTYVTVNAPMVRVRFTFLGKTFYEDYPIQDSAYEAKKVIDQNMLNKAKQRALAKVISMGTGIGFKLYEGKDLQFEDNQPEVKQKSKTTKTPPKEEPIMDAKNVPITPILNLKEEDKAPNIDVVEELPPIIIEDTPEVNLDVEEVIKLIKTSDETKVDSALAKYDSSFTKFYGMKVLRTDSESQLSDKLSRINDIGKFRKALEKLINV